MKTFVSNSTESTRMFKANWMEALSKVHYSVPLFIYIPVIAFFSWRGLSQESTTATTALFGVLGGFLAWTLTEYVLHRFVFHYHPSSEWERKSISSSMAYTTIIPMMRCAW